MNSSSPFVEHSFRRLKLLIHQQDALDRRDFHFQRSLTSSSSKTFESSEDFNSNGFVTSTRQRTFSRPPKTRSISYRFPSDQFESSSSSNILLEQIQRNHFEKQIENDRRNDLREKFNIPPPFERQWLRQPRYVPQERPRIGQMND